jgi:cobaltochelatase CobN
MHIQVRGQASLDETLVAEDLDQPPGEIVILSFSDSDLQALAGAWRVDRHASLRLANLARLRHPMSVDLYVEKTLAGARAILVRQLGGLDYWRYGAEEVARLAREKGIALGFIPGDGRADPRLSALSTLSWDITARLEALFDAGGPDNLDAVLRVLSATAQGEAPTLPDIVPVPEQGQWRTWPAMGEEKARAALVFYRSYLLAGDLEPVEALCAALDARGLAVEALFVPSLKAPAAAAWLQTHLKATQPDVIINLTAFSARGDERAVSPLEAADAPILQATLANASRAAWAASGRGLSATDLAMQVVLPEVDGRIQAGIISFKEEDARDPDLHFARRRHKSCPKGVAHAADLVAAWAKLRQREPAQTRIGLILSTYPGRSDRLAHAVGLDGPESAVRIVSSLRAAGYETGSGNLSAKRLLARLSRPGDCRMAALPLVDYEHLFAQCPTDFRASVHAAWGAPAEDPALCDGVFLFRASLHGRCLIALQPERGDAGDRKAAYHDATVPPRHAYIAFYLWLRHVWRSDAMIHLGAHGTLEWLPGKGVALSSACAPRVLAGALPVLYPFIVNDPGEAAQAKRRLGAVTIGHMTPPLVEAGQHGDMSEIEGLVDEFSAAEGLDPRRRDRIAALILDKAQQNGLAADCGLTKGMPLIEAVARIDAFLCDIKEMRIRDGLHVFGDSSGEMEGLLAGLSGRFVPPGPSGAPSRGRADVLPTGRNLFGIDPRAVPTRTGWELGERAAQALVARYVQDHGDWPRAFVMDLWGSATMRTGGEELAAAMALIGARPVWDHASNRVNGFEIMPAAALGRPRIDVTLRISGLFRDVFPAQIALFDAAVRRIALLDEADGDNPLAAASRHGETQPDRVFGAAEGAYGIDIASRLERDDWQDRAELGAIYLDASATVYRADGVEAGHREDYAARVRAADGFVHVQDHAETDLFSGTDYAAHEGGFAAAAAALGNDRAALYHADTADPAHPRLRSLAEESARVLRARAANPRWLDGQMRHGFAGAAEIAAALDGAYAFAATAGTVGSQHFDTLYAATLGDARVAAFLASSNPAALAAMRRRFAQAWRRGFWQPRRNSIIADLTDEA